jgi:hypothetical protein
MHSCRFVCPMTRTSASHHFLPLNQIDNEFAAKRANGAWDHAVVQQAASSIPPPCALRHSSSEWLQAELTERNTSRA